MKEYVFDERSMIEEIINNGIVEKENPCKTIKKLARYNYYVLGLNDKDNYDKINEYMRLNCENYTEIGFYKSIQGCIKDAKESNWRQIINIAITADELNKISSLGDDRKEKIAFVLLADAKYDNEYRKNKLNISYLQINDIFKMARVSMPTQERALFMHFLYDNCLIDMNLNPESNAKKLKYVSDSNDSAAIILDELNYKELAFTYMNWKYGGYKQCKTCGRLFKAKKNKQYCNNCLISHNEQTTKILICKDCGREFVVPIRSNRKIRCDECQKKRQLEYQRISMANKRHKDVK